MTAVTVVLVVIVLLMSLLRSNMFAENDPKSTLESVLDVVAAMAGLATVIVWAAYFASRSN